MSDAKKAAVKLANEVVKAGLWPCCINCEHWCEVTEITDTDRVYFKCGKYNMIPPAETIVVGCVHHLAQIPF